MKKIQPDESYKQIHAGDIFKYSQYGIKRMVDFGFLPLPGHPDRSQALKAIRAYRVQACEDYREDSISIECITIADPYYWWDDRPPGSRYSWQPSILMVVQKVPVITQARRLTVKGRDV